MTDRIKAKDYAATGRKGTKRVKGAKRVIMDGITFDSKREAKRWAELCLLERAGDISNLERQVKYPLRGQEHPILTPTGRQMHYIADFRYVDWRLGGVWVVEDAKGWQTEVSRLKLAILAAQGQKVELV